DSFGNSSGSSLTRYTYTGREFEEYSGLYYYRARWYDPQVGRFTSEDPIEFEGGINWFTYVENNPVNNDDAAGLMGRGGRGKGHNPSLRRDPWDWLKRFVGRRRRFDGEKGHAEELWVRCRELEKWMEGRTQSDLSEERLLRHLMDQYDWCRKRFPTSCKNTALNPPERSSEPSPAANQNRTWEGGDFDAVPRWDDGTPLDPQKYPEIYREHEARRAARYWGTPVFPINPGMPFPGRVSAPVRVPLRPVFVE
ncbi:MAG TPA: RHS repeat-associated core domain-containing protein, partial [Pyrinomonadaceae bacterium]|nr:RHS repeat-associated core domain-containing protein [Pyrinomonadaceae bacterium]